jgi:lipoyl(octanoyl) transferase
MEWRIDNRLIDYQEAESFQEKRADAIARGEADELIWFLEHPPLYSAGPRSKPSDLLAPARFPVYQTRRGGELTYHGPGQRTVYVLVNLANRRKDVRAFVWALEEWIIRALGAFNVIGERRDDRVGVWVRRTDRNDPHSEDKIAALGVRLKRWVSFHGIAINVAPDLTHFSGITPCGISGHGVTSLADLGVSATMADLDGALKKHFFEVFHNPQRWLARN